MCLHIVYSEFDHVCLSVSEGQKVSRTFQYKPIYVPELFEMVCYHKYHGCLALENSLRRQKLKFNVSQFI